VSFGYLPVTADEYDPPLTACLDAVNPAFPMKPSRRMEAAETVIGTPMDAERAAVHSAEIDSWFDDSTRALAS
jgi:hypothetical protein